MAALESFTNMHDIALKPRMLRTLLREHVPEVKQPMSSPLGLSKAVSLVQTHKLLSESFTESTEQSLVEKWKSAVDDWVDRLMELLSSNMPDKCWAGICLVGITSQECSADRFLASNSIWFNKLLLFIQPPAESQIVKVASCISISDFLTRMDGFPKLKKDATSHAAKLIEPVLKLLSNDTSEAVWEGALHLLATILMLFPASLHRHYENVENAIAAKIFSVKCSDSMSKKFANFLSLLPKSKGDEGSWSLLMHKLLLHINANLNNVFQGLEEVTKCTEAINLLVAPGKDPPPPLGGQAGFGDDTRSERILISRISALISCCGTMLKSSYHVQVRVPIRSLLALVERVLMVDGSLPHNKLRLMTIMQHELICSELPVLHSYGLDLLTAIIKSIRSQLLPHAGYILRLVTRYFRKCKLPELRIKVYSVTKLLLISMGVGMAIHIAEVVVANASEDLKHLGVGGHDKASVDNSNSSADILLQPKNRKRKHGIATGLEQQPAGTGLDVGIAKNPSATPISVKIAALEALEALLTVGGATMPKSGHEMDGATAPESWRSSVDILLMSTATNVCKGVWANQGSYHFLPNESASTLVDFQLVSLRALLASLLSPRGERPAFLSEGLELFRRGKQETGTKLAELCAHALLALEVVIHPRGLPINDIPSAYKSSDAVAISDDNDDDKNDYLNDEYQEIIIDMAADKNEITRGRANHAEDNNVSLAEVPGVGTDDTKKRQAGADDIQTREDVVMVESRHNEDPAVEFHEKVVEFHENVFSAATSVPEVTETGFSGSASKGEAFDHKEVVPMKAKATSGYDSDNSSLGSFPNLSELDSDSDSDSD